MSETKTDVKVQCPMCRGERVIYVTMEHMEQCRYCEGTGQVVKPSRKTEEVKHDT